eukprot:gene126-biopygen10733
MRVVLTELVRALQLVQNTVGDIFRGVAQREAAGRRGICALRDDNKGAAGISDVGFPGVSKGQAAKEIPGLHTSGGAGRVVRRRRARGQSRVTAAAGEGNQAAFRGPQKEMLRAAFTACVPVVWWDHATRLGTHHSHMKCRRSPPWEEHVGYLGVSCSPFVSPRFHGGILTPELLGSLEPGYYSGDAESHWDVRSSTTRCLPPSRMCREAVRQGVEWAPRRGAG